MANSIQLITKYLPGALDKVFAFESVTDQLLGDQTLKLDFLDNKTVKVPKLMSTGLTDYQRGGSGSVNTRGAVANQWETFTLSQQRYSEIPLDRLDNEESGSFILGHQATEFIRTKVIPEFDAYRLSKLAGYTNAVMGNRVVETIAANTILSKLNASFKWLRNHGVQDTDQIIYVRPAVMELIENTTELYRKLSQSEYHDKVTFQIQNYEGRPIVVVPDDRFFTDINILAGGGYAPKATSKVINFIVCDRRAPIVIRRLDFARVYDSIKENGTYLGFVGYLLTNLYYHDLFVTDNKVVGIYASISNEDATGVATVVNAAVVAGATAGKSIVSQVVTTPAGLIYDTIYEGSDVQTIGAAPVTTNTAAVSLGVEFTPKAASNQYVSVAYAGKIVAVSPKIATMPVGA